MDFSGFEVVSGEQGDALTPFCALSKKKVLRNYAFGIWNDAGNFLFRLLIGIRPQNRRIEGPAQTSVEPEIFTSLSFLT